MGKDKCYKITFSNAVQMGMSVIPAGARRRTQKRGERRLPGVYAERHRNGFGEHRMLVNDINKTVALGRTRCPVGLGPDVEE